MVRSSKDGSSITIGTWYVSHGRVLPTFSFLNTTLCISPRNRSAAPKPDLSICHMVTVFPTAVNTESVQLEFVPAMSEIAREAGALLMGHFRRTVKIEYKGDVDLVTVADRESEALVLSRIREQWPSHDVMGEEGSRIQT